MRKKKRSRRPLSSLVHSGELSAPDKENYDTFRLFYRRHSIAATSELVPRPQRDTECRRRKHPRARNFRNGAA